MSDFVRIMNILFLTGAAIFIAKNLNLLDYLNFNSNPRDPNPQAKGQVMAGKLQSDAQNKQPATIQNSLINAALVVDAMEVVEDS